MPWYHHFNVVADRNQWKDEREVEERTSGTKDGSRSVWTKWARREGEARKDDFKVLAVD